MEKIKVEKENVMNFYEELGSSNFKMQSKTLEKFGSAKLDIYFKSIGFVSAVTGVIGIIAGFGFTAFSFIQSKFLFFTGEAILFYAIFKGLTWVQHIYTSEYKSLENEFNKHQKYFKKRNEAFTIIYNQLISESHEINRTDIENLQKIDQEMLILFKPNEDDKLPQVIYSKEVYFCLLTGTIILFSSFFIYDLISFLLSFYIH